jgi:hypothetical protein
VDPAFPALASFFRTYQTKAKVEIDYQPTSNKLNKSQLVEEAAADCGITASASEKLRRMNRSLVLGSDYFKFEEGTNRIRICTIL